ncbi:hypothetical protein BKA93DRAFT_516560 [Sparassis latifolia]
MIDTGLLQALSTLPHLTDLIITCADQDVNAVPCGGFGTQQSLHISCLLVEAMPIITAISAPQLSALVFERRVKRSYGLDDSKNL